MDEEGGVSTYQHRDGNGLCHPGRKRDGPDECVSVDVDVAAGGGRLGVGVPGNEGPSI